MVRLLADQAAARPDHPWLVFDGEDTLTYAEAWDLAKRFATALKARVGAKCHVGLFLRNQVEFLPTFYGTMAAGGVASPFNADAKGPLLGHIVERSDASVIIARFDLLDRLEELDSLSNVELVVVVGEGKAPEKVGGVRAMTWDAFLEGAAAEEPESFPAFDDVALIQFTSGTTSFSKGAVYPHHFLYLYSATLSDSLGRTPDDVLTTPLPLFHVAALHIIANSALHAGATAHLKSRFSASQFWNQAAADGATFSIILGPMAAIIMKTVDSAPEHRMRTMFCVPPPPGRADFESRFNVKMLWQGYGMTEVYPLPMRSEMLAGVTDDTLGYPATYYDYGVVDEHDRLLAPGEEGELVFRPLLPSAMMREYYKDPQATVQALRNFAFHTGDIATCDEDGLIHYRGRKQERLRRRGENVSAFELELVALRHELIMEAAAYGVPSEFGEHDIKLDVILKADLDLAELHKWLDENLPRYMVPRYLERREQFPKTPSERVEKFKLASEPADRPGVYDAEKR